VSITRELQKELKRVGCYDGEINAVWTQSARKAMKDFLDWVNASLPVSQPDNVLLSLVQGHPGNACSKSCLAGEGLSQDGKRCIPNAVLAQTAKKAKPTPAVTEWTTTVTAVTASPPALDGRMALAGPAPDASAITPPAADAAPRTKNPSVRRDHVARHIPSYGRPTRSSRSNFVQSVLRQTSMY
jgi:hypothetical protein